MKVTYMVCDTIRKLIGQADDAIREQRYDDLMEFYTDDAVLVVRPGKEAHGKDEIKRAFMAIAGYFNGYVSPRQGNMVMLEAGDTVLGTLPVGLASEVCARGARFFSLTLDLTPEARGKELDLTMVRAFRGRLEEFVVTKRTDGVPLYRS